MRYILYTISAKTDKQKRRGKTKNNLFPTSNYREYPEQNSLHLAKRITVKAPLGASHRLETNKV